MTEVSKAGPEAGTDSWREVSTPAPLRALQARTPVPAWARRAVCEGREPDAGDLYVRFDERDVKTESWLNH
jgi:hypothetical protein